jgi:hypothetical protein
MLSPVHLDYDPQLMACEIGNEIPDRHLPPKVRVGKACAQKAPHSLLCVGRVAA